MKYLFFGLLLWGTQLFGMEEIKVEDGATEMLASIGSQILMGVIFVAPAIAIGSLFALMRFDKAHKAFLQHEIKEIDEEIDKLRDASLQVHINPEVERLYGKLEALKQAYERI